MFKLKSLIYFLPGLASLIYLPSLKYGFSQDDFIHLYSSRAESIGQFLNFFNPSANYPDIYFFRPLTTQVYFFFNQTLFGLNPVLFHIETLTVHIVNTYLFYYLVKLIWKKQIALLSSIFYAFLSVHFISLYYISSFQELGRTFFILLSIIFFVKYIKSGARKLYLASIFAFAGALLSKETSVIFPGLLICFELLRARGEKLSQIFRDTFKNELVYFAVLFIYLALRISGFHQIFNDGSYNSTFSLAIILQNLKWYLIWSFGLPEIISTYSSISVGSLMQFIKDFPQSLWILTSFLIFLVSILLALFGKKIVIKSTILISLVFFMIPLLPVLFLQGHRYPQYLDLSMIVFLPFLSNLLLEAKFKKVILPLGILSFCLLQFVSLQISENTHWTTHRAKVAKSYYEQLSIDSFRMDNATIIFLGTFQALDEVSVALAKNYALKVWYPKVNNVLYLNDENGTKGVNNAIIKKVEIF